MKFKINDINILTVDWMYDRYLHNKNNWRSVKESEHKELGLPFWLCGCKLKSDEIIKIKIPDEVKDIFEINNESSSVSKLEINGKIISSKDLRDKFIDKDPSTVISLSSLGVGKLTSEKNKFEDIDITYKVSLKIKDYKKFIELAYGSLEEFYKINKLPGENDIIPLLDLPPLCELHPSETVVPEFEDLFIHNLMDSFMVTEFKTEKMKTKFTIKMLMKCVPDLAVLKLNFFPSKNVDTACSSAGLDIVKDDIIKRLSNGPVDEIIRNNFFNPIFDNKIIPVPEFSSSDKIDILDYDFLRERCKRLNYTPCFDELHDRFTYSESKNDYKDTKVNFTKNGVIYNNLYKDLKDVNIEFEFKKTLTINMKPNATLNKRILLMAKSHKFGGPSDEEIIASTKDLECKVYI